MPGVGAYAHAPAGATTQVLTGKGVLRRVHLRAPGTAVGDIYDNTTTTGTPIFSIPAAGQAINTIELNIPVSLGIRVVNAVSGPALVVMYEGE
jgi:hypothetical protein